MFRLRSASPRKRHGNRGALWQDVLDAVTPLGLAPMNGSSPTVGATGYMLGGGHSPTLGRSLGWAAEYISALELVTADGQVRKVTAESEPEPRWASPAEAGFPRACSRTSTSRESWRPEPT
jgi:hypothetical protein